MHTLGIAGCTLHFQSVGHSREASHRLRRNLLHSIFFHGLRRVMGGRRTMERVD